MDEREKGGQREHSETSKSSLRPQHVEQQLEEVLRRVEDRLGVGVEHQDQELHGKATRSQRQAVVARATPSAWMLVSPQGVECQDQQKETHGNLKSTTACREQQQWWPEHGRRS